MLEDLRAPAAVRAVRGEPCAAAWFVLAWRLDVAETVGSVIDQVAGGVCGVRPAAERAGVEYETALPPVPGAAPGSWGWRSRRWPWSWTVRRSRRLPRRAGSRWRRSARRLTRRQACRDGPAGRLAVRLGGDRREADRRPHSLALVRGRQAAFHASYPAMTA